MEQEIWRDVKGYEGIYQISSIGRVKSLPRIIHRRKMGDVSLNEKICSPIQDGRGYTMVHLSNNRDKRKIYRIHRLVAEAFIPNPDNKPFVDHINGIRDDNRVDNLRWCTHIENCNFELAKKHQSEVKIGNKNPIYGKVGKDNHSHKAVLQYDLQGNFIKKYFGLAEAQRETGVLFQNISKACKGERKSAGGYMWRFENEPIPIEEVRMIIVTKEGVKKYMTKTTGFGVTKRKTK